MDEQQTSQSQQKKSSKKKTTKIDDAKVAEAKRKVNDLLQGTGFEDPVTFVPPTEDAVTPTMNNDNATTWLNEQVAKLSEQVESLQFANNQLKNDNAKLMNALNGGGGSVTADFSNDRVKITELYRYFENIYTGNNPMRQPFDIAKFSNPSHGTGILDMFLNTFPYLQEDKRYKHRG